MINNELLKIKILELAVSGRLIKNNPYLPAVEVEEVKSNLAFDIPQNWRWVRYGTIAESKMGKTILRSNLIDKGIPVYSATQQDKVFGFVKSSNLLLKKGDIVIPARGNSIGYAMLVKDEVATCTQTTICSTNISKVSSQYLVYCCQYFRKNWFRFSGAAIPQVTIKQINNNILPLPPIEEQELIVNRLEEIFALIDKKNKNDTLIDTLRNKLKDTILDNAFKGNLLNNNFNSILIGEKTENDLYNLPQNWKWVKLKDICNKIVDGDHNPAPGETFSTKYLMLSAININNNKLNIETNVRYLSKDNFEKVNKRTKVSKGDVLLSIVGTIGRSCIYDINANITFQRSVAILTTTIYNKYLKYYFDSPYVQKHMSDGSSGAVQQGFYLRQLSKMPVPLPSIEEQKKIVDKIEKIFDLIDKL